MTEIMTSAETRKWIEGRYGPIEHLQRQVMVRGTTKTFSVVRLMKGVAFGIGFSQEEALQSLYQDLAPGKKPL